MAHRKSAAAMGVVGQILRAAKPGAAIAGAVGVGAVAAQLGGTVLMSFDSVESFVAGDPMKEAAVDLAGGLLVDAALLAGASVVWDKRASMQLAPYLVGGSVVSALAPLLQEHIAALVEKGVDLLTFETPGGVAALPPRRAALPAGSVIDI